MHDYQRAIAEFFARLVSVPTLDGLPEEERRRLLDDYCKLCLGVGHAAVQAAPVSERMKQRQFDALTRQPGLGFGVQRDYAWVEKGLMKLHHTAREFLVRMVTEHEWIEEPQVNLPRRRLRVSPADALTQTVVASGPDVLTSELLLLLRTTDSFPFRRCPVCETVFVPVRHQKYCSPRCTSQANEAARKGTRLEYQREYMAKKRARAKVRAKAEERARKRVLTPVVKLRGTLAGKPEKR